MAKRKTYSEEFKREAVRLLVTREDRPAAEVAKGLGVSTSQLYQWQRRYADVVATAVNGRGETKDEELARLRREVSVLRKEKDVLKKSIGLFVRDIER
jgi:transposase